MRESQYSRNFIVNLHYHNIYTHLLYSLQSRYCKNRHTCSNDAANFDFVEETEIQKRNRNQFRKVKIKRLTLTIFLQQHALCLQRKLRVQKNEQHPAKTNPNRKLKDRMPAPRVERKIDTAPCNFKYFSKIFVACLKISHSTHVEKRSI